MQQKITDDLDALLAVLPPPIANRLHELNEADKLLEIVLDLGRPPEARFTDRDIELLPREVTHDDIRYVVERIGDFTEDNRAGIARTLHRISAIRNRKGDIVGLTCRVGRAVYGTIDIIQDIITSGKSILLLGRPGVGKTTLLREAARVLADQKKRVVIVDTSNEIGGDGDIPHPAIGRARRMQVPLPSLQHEVMIEAVENHMPEVIIIDEIGRALEAEAARTIAERGVQLIGTAHGRTLSNLLLNPTLSDLVGGVESVTLSDEEARRRGTQKAVLERRAPPTFDILIEIVDRQHLIVHKDVARAVDALLRDRPLRPEIRYRDERGEIVIKQADLEEFGGRAETLTEETLEGVRRRNGGRGEERFGGRGERLSERGDRFTVRRDTLPFADTLAADELAETTPKPGRILRAYCYGVGQNRLRAAAQSLGVPVEITNDLHRADIVITLKAYYRKQPQPILEAESRGVPVYVLRSNTTRQMEILLAEIFALRPAAMEPLAEALEEARQGVEKVLAGAPVVELSPQPPEIRRQQHRLAREANLISHSYGREPNRRVRIYRE
ncbi:MAG: AAA family ATPase [Caldilineales bacterium]|nr:AAA family ATPase [Caldilineales bacterium]